MSPFGAATGTPTVLQCDRAFEGAEISDKTTADLPTIKLQCDRAFEGAEMRHGWRGRDLASACFNVTALLKARKFTVTPGTKARMIVLQCDRAFEGAEICSSVKSPITSGLLQCDRAFEGAEIIFQKISRRGGVTLQCDRAFEGAEIHVDPMQRRRMGHASM